jgi:hypothetical protein
MWALDVAMNAVMAAVEIMRPRPIKDAREFALVYFGPLCSANVPVMQAVAKRCNPARG